jgi:hypothetical protein
MECIGVAYKTEFLRWGVEVPKSNRMIERE